MKNFIGLISAALVGLDSMTRWIIEISVGFTDVGLLRISESVRAYAYLILSSQASARSSIVGNTASSLTPQSAFLNNFENVVNRRVNIQEDINPISTGLFCLVVALGGGGGGGVFHSPSITSLSLKLDCSNFVQSYF